MGECAVDREEYEIQEYQGGCHCGAAVGLAVGHTAAR